MHKIFEKGRSMIEMLGVLAIIGVLSVGGIAGYSKAMEKFKINKLSHEYSDFIFSLIQYAPAFQKDLFNSQSLRDVSQNLNIMPKTWTTWGAYFIDSYKNYSYMSWYKSSGLNIEIIFGNNIKKVCPELFQSLIIPMHDVLQYSRLISMSHTSEYFYGDKICDGKNKKCIRDLSPTTIAEMCRECSKYERCNLVFFINPWL